MWINRIEIVQQTYAVVLLLYQGEDMAAQRHEVT